MKVQLQFLFCLFLSFQIVNAQSSYKLFEKAPRIQYKNSNLNSNRLFKEQANHIQQNINSQVIPVLIGKMLNAYTTQGSYTNQIYTDPFSGFIVVIHRSSRTHLSNGGMVIQGSDNGGANWTQESQAFTLPLTFPAHPNIVLSNPIKSNVAGGEKVVTNYAIMSANWGALEFVRDSCFGCYLFSRFRDSAYFPGDEMFVNSKGFVFAPVALSEYRVVGNDTIIYDLFFSADYGKTWTKSAMLKLSECENDAVNGIKGFINKNGVGYLVVEGKRRGQTFYSFAYKKTTDDGITWDSTWTWVNPFQLPDLAGKVHALNYEVDVITDDAGRLHFAGTFVDTARSGTESNTGIYHIWGDGTDWQGKLVKKVNKTFLALPGGLYTLNEVEFAINYYGNLIMIKFTDTKYPTDSFYDIWIAITVTTSGGYLVKNLTDSPTINEKFSQMSPYLYQPVMSTARADIMYTIFGNNDTDDLAEASLYYVNNILIWDEIDEVNPMSDFNLYQNYPNPFNSTTKIKFTLPENSKVDLSIYNILGEKVKTLVDRELDRGEHQVDFNSDGLSAGVYFYKLIANSYSKAKKLVLVK